MLGVDDGRRRTDSDWYGEVFVIAFAAVCESQIQRADEGRGHWDKQAELARSFLSIAGTLGFGAESPVLDHNRWE